jgi:hypothetical protein
MGCLYYFVVWGSDEYLKGMKAQSDQVATAYCDVLKQADEKEVGGKVEQKKEK